MIPRPLRPALYAQLSYAGLAVAWQLIGVALLSMGRSALGPTASLAVAAQAVIVAAVYVAALRRSPLLFVLLSTLSALAAGLTISTAFRLEASLWPSDAARYLSVAINCVGLVGFILAVTGYVRWRCIPNPAPEP